MSRTLDLKTRILQIFPSIQKYRFKVLGFFKSCFVFLRYTPGSSVNFGPPRGFHLDSTSYSLSNREKANGVEEIFLKREEIFSRSMPITNSKLVKNKFQKFKESKVILKKGYRFLESRYLAGNGGTVITSDDKVFIPCSPLRNEWRPERHQSLYKLRLPSLVKMDKVILIETRCAEGNYGHWMMDHLPRFQWLKAMNLDLSQYTLISNAAGMKYQNDSYEVLDKKGFIFKDVVNVTRGHFYCRELIIPPYSTRDLNGDFTSYGRENEAFLKQLFLDSKSRIDLGRKIYLSRRRSLRSSPQEKELVDQLACFGIKEVFLEDYTISEQASIFNNADLVIGYHGAGLTNIYFCRPKTTIIEIFGPDFIVTNFWGLANQLELRYIAYCEDKYCQGIENYRVARQSPTTIDIDDFLRFIEPFTRTSINA